MIVPFPYAGRTLQTIISPQSGIANQRIMQEAVKVAPGADRFLLSPEGAFRW
jgi:hypothetical protein